MHNNVNTGGGGVPSRFPIIEEQSRQIPSIAVSNVGDNLNHRPRLINQYQTSAPNVPIMFRPHYHHHNNNSFNNHHNHRYLYEPYSLSRPGENRYVRPPPSSQCGLLLEPHHGYCPPSQQNQPQQLQSPSSVLNLVCHRPISLSSHSSIYNGAASAGSVANSNSYVHHVHHGNSDHQMKPNSSLITPSPPLAPLPLLSQIKMASLSQQQQKQQQASSPPASSSNRNSSNKSINNKNVSKQQTSQQALGKLLNNNGGSYERLDAFLKPRPPHSRDIVPKFYRSVIDDVMASIREIFLDDGIDEQVIQEMKQTWERKVMESPAVEQALQQQQQQVSTISSTSTTNTNSSKQSEKSSNKTSSSTTNNSAGGQTTSVITSNPNHVNKNGSSSSTNSNSNNKNNSRNNKNSGDSSSSTTKSSPNIKPTQTTNVVKQTTINPNTNVMVNANQSSININSTGSSQTQQPLTEQLFRASAIVPNNSIGMTAALASASPTITTTPSNIVGGGTANILGHISQQQPHPSLQQTALLQEPQIQRQDDLKKMREADEIRLMQEQQQRQEFRNVSPQSMPINLSTTNQYLLPQQRNASPDMARNYVNDRHYVDAILNNHHQQNNIDNSIAATQKYYAAMLAASSPSSLSNSAADAHRFQLAMNANHGSGNDGGSNIPGLIGRSFGINQSNSNNNKEVKFQPGMPPGGQKIVFLPNLMQGGPLVINQDLLNSINLQQGGIITSGGQPIFQHPGLGGGTIQYTTAIRPGGPLPHGMPQGVALHQPTSTIQPIVRPIVTLPTMVSAVPQPTPQQMAPQQTAGPTITRVAQLDGQQDQNDSSEDDDDDDEYRDNDDDLDDNDDEMNDEENEPGVEEEPLNSEDDVSDEDPDELFETDNVVVCQFDKITRSRNKWKFHFKDGIMNLQGKDYVFSRAVGDAEW